MFKLFQKAPPHALLSLEDCGEQQAIPRNKFSKYQADIRLNDKIKKPRDRNSLTTVSISWRSF